MEIGDRINMITPATSTVVKISVLLIQSSSLLQAQYQKILTKLKLSVNGTVHAVQVDECNNLLYIGGDFIEVGRSLPASQSGNENYNPAQDVIQILTVNKAPLTVTADNKTKTCGDPNPEFTLAYFGFKGTDGPADIDRTLKQGKRCG